MGVDGQMWLTLHGYRLVHHTATKQKFLASSWEDGTDSGLQTGSSANKYVMPQCPSLYSDYGLMQLVITPLPTHSLLFLTHTLTQCHMFPSVGVWMYSITGFHQPRKISLHSSFFLSHTCCVFDPSHTHLLPPFPFLLSFICFLFPVSLFFSEQFPVHFLALFSFSQLFFHLI